MKLAISNIAWGKENDNEIYDFIKENSYSAIEIAPTRIIEDSPYKNLDFAKEYANRLREEYKLKICSMQSILYGKTERLFGTNAERIALLDYTKEAIDFASVIECKNLVFGSPKNRVIENEEQYEIAIDFFRELGEYALSKNTIISIEANPKIYSTNFINTTEEAFAIVKKVNSLGFQVNLDLGTMIENNENFNILRKNINLVNHTHISEPFLKEIKQRDLHKKFCSLLKELQYDNYISIEMQKLEDLDSIKKIVLYIKEIFGE